MKYSKEELQVIQEKIPELIPKPSPSNNRAIIAFLKKYEVLDQLPKDITSKEWFSIKKSVLDDKDFPKFQNDYFTEVTEYNQKINKKLDNPKIQNELDLLIKNYVNKERIRYYINPIYCKYKKNANKKRERKFNKINISIWFSFVLRIFIVLIMMLLIYYRLIL